MTAAAHRVLPARLVAAARFGTGLRKLHGIGRLHEAG